MKKNRGDRAVRSIFLLALAVMFVVWYVVEDAKTMKTFFIVFLIYYMTSMIHHSIFFSRMSNRL